MGSDEFLSTVCSATKFYHLTGLTWVDGGLQRRACRGKLVWKVMRQLSEPVESYLRKLKAVLVLDPPWVDCPLGQRVLPFPKKCPAPRTWQ